MKAMRYIALAEATSFLALLVASFLKHQDKGELGVQILGPIHGLLFIAYVVIALEPASPAGWSVCTTFWILVGVPWRLRRRLVAAARGAPRRLIVARQ